MEDRLITTFSEYKETYQTRLENHLAKYVDFDELHFIQSELKYYKTCYATANVTKHEIYYNNDDYEYYKHVYCNDIENDERTELEENEAIRLMIIDLSKPETNCYNIEICERLTISFGKIIDFLQELEYYKSIENIKQSSILQQHIRKEPSSNELTDVTNNESQKNLNTIEWQGTTLEFCEFTKALIESGFISKVKTEKEIFDKMKQFFNVENFDKSEKLKQVRQRTRDPTPVINKLETALTNWIRRKD